MLKKYISKFTVDILPSVLATIIGAYIVNHYISPKSDSPTAAVASVAATGNADKSSADVATTPASGIKAKGISEKALLEKTASERPAVADKPAESASLAAEPSQSPATEKPAAKAARGAPPALAPASPTEPAAAEEKRDANDLARAAIERLRAGEPHIREAARGPEPAHAESRAISAAVQPLPPPVVVATPGPAASYPVTASLGARQPYSAAQTDERQRQTPPAEIPSLSSPLDLRADAGDQAPRQRTSVAEDVLSAAKSVAVLPLSAAKTVFHAVLPR